MSANVRSIRRIMRLTLGTCRPRIITYTPSLTQVAARRTYSSYNAAVSGLTPEQEEVRDVHISLLIAARQGTMLPAQHALPRHVPRPDHTNQ